MNDKAFCKQRMELFANPNTFWGKHRIELAELERVMEFPNEAYHRIDFPDVDFRAMLLTRRYLAKLRLKLVRLHRQHKTVTQYAEEYYSKQQKQGVLNHINHSRKQHGLDPIEKVWW